MKMASCIGCGGKFPVVDGPTHRYMEASPGCWAGFGVVLAREYSDMQYHSVHRLTVDAYAMQHPGRPTPQCIRSVALHGISLCAVLEEGVELEQANGIIQKAARNKERFVWLPPPSSMGAWTVADVQPAKTPQEHARRVRQWAESTWAAWSVHHPVFRNWMKESLTL